MAHKLEYHIRDYIENGRDFVLARIVATRGSSPRKEDSIMVMNAGGKFMGTVGGGRIEAETEKKCREVFETKPEEGVLCHFVLNTEEEDALDMACGGEADILVEYIRADDPGNVLDHFVNEDVAYLFGGGHVALALEPILRHVGFDTVVIDDRKEYANAERFPHALRTIVVDSFAQAFDDIECDENSYLVIVTRGHMGDLDVLREALKQKRAYLGMIGSRHKDKILYDKLKEEGVTQDQIDKVYAPIGEDIFAETPEEIGVSIAAEMIKVRSGHGTR